MDVALKGEIDGIGFTQEEIEALQEAYSIYVTDTVPAGTYEEVAEGNTFLPSMPYWSCVTIWMKISFII